MLLITFDGDYYYINKSLFVLYENKKISFLLIKLNYSGSGGGWRCNNFSLLLSIVQKFHLLLVYKGVSFNFFFQFRYNKLKLIITQFSRAQREIHIVWREISLRKKKLNLNKFCKYKHKMTFFFHLSLSLYKTCL